MGNLYGFEPGFIAPYKKMYTTLFNAITDALRLMGEGDLTAANALLKQAQQATEELYISQK